MYEWRARHRAILEQVRNHPPKAVILGNSITHYWGGEPEHRNGTVSKMYFGVYTTENWMAIRPEKLF